MAVALCGAGPILSLAIGGAILLAVGNRLKIGIAQKIVAALLSLIGVAQGVVGSGWGGKTYAVWQPAESVRD